MSLAPAALTRASLLGLVGGLLAGLAGHRTGLPAMQTAGSVASLVGALWVALLQMITLPLALALTLAAIGSATAGAVGKIGSRAAALFLLALGLMGVFALAVVSGILSGVAVDPAAVAAMRSAHAVATPPPVAMPHAGSWIDNLIPSNIFDAAARGALFPLLLFGIAFATAVTRLPEAKRESLTRLFQAVAQAMLVLVRWTLVLTPLGVFALTFVIALRTGASLAGLLGVYLALHAGVTLLCTALIYPVAAGLGRVPVARFARGVLPAQIVAVSTRSSVASLPAMVEGGREHLGLSTTATTFVLPLAVSLFRIDEVIANPIKLLFLAHVYQIPLQPGVIVAFMATVILFSFSGTGTPNSGGGVGFRMVPIFFAAGIPIEGVMILEAVETIPDIFATLANVTGQVGATTILARTPA
ncbi:MAG TPA: cation:dicarboxylase symporter family transporter [Gemmatimonadales bacterium]